MRQISLCFQKPWNYLLAFMRVKNQFCFHIIFSYLTRISHYLQINYHLRSTKVLSLEMLWHCIKFLSVPAYSPSFVKQDHMYSHWSTILIQLFKSSWRTNSPVLCITLHFQSHYTCMYIYLHTFFCTQGQRYCDWFIPIPHSSRNCGSIRTGFRKVI